VSSSLSKRYAAQAIHKEEEINDGDGEEEIHDDDDHDEKG